MLFSSFGTVGCRLFYTVLHTELMNFLYKIMGCSTVTCPITVLALILIPSLLDLIRAERLETCKTDPDCPKYQFCEGKVCAHCADKSAEFRKNNVKCHDDNYHDALKFTGAALGVILLVSLIPSAICCFFCPSCPLNQWRKRRVFGGAENRYTPYTGGTASTRFQPVPVPVPVDTATSGQTTSYSPQQSEPAPDFSS